MVEWVGAAVITLERLGFDSNPATNFYAGEVPMCSNLGITVSRTPRVDTTIAPKSALIASNRSKIKLTSEPERRDEEVDLFDTLEERLSFHFIVYYNERISNQLPTTTDQVITIVTVQLTLS